VGGGLVDHLLQSCSAGLDKVAIEPANGLLVGRRWDNNTGIISLEGGVKPQEIAVSTFDLKFGLLVCL